MKLSRALNPMLSSVPMNSYLTPSTPGYDASLPAPEYISESRFWTQVVQIAPANLEEAGFTK